MNISLILSIINLILALVALIYVLTVTTRVKGVIGNKFPPFAFLILVSANVIDILNILGVISIGDYAIIIRKLSVTFLIIFLAFYFHGIKRLIKKIDNNNYEPHSEKHKEKSKAVYEKDDGYLELKVKK